MADVYRVIYVETAGENAQQVVSATSQANAIAAASAADSDYSQLISVQTIALGITVGS